jgi:hypothetical protein
MEACIASLHDYSRKKFTGVVQLQKDTARPEFECGSCSSNTCSSQYFCGSTISSDLTSQPFFSYHRDNFKASFTTDEKESLVTGGIQELQLISSTNEQQINWGAIKNSLPDKSEIQCLMKYRNDCDPTINHDKWTPADEKSLLSAVDAFQERDWSRIADAVLANEVDSSSKRRTPMQCLQYYQLNLNKSLMRPTEWSTEEDTLLLEATALYGMYACMHYSAANNSCVISQPFSYST